MATRAYLAVAISLLQCDITSAASLTAFAFSAVTLLCNERDQSSAQALVAFEWDEQEPMALQAIHVREVGENFALRSRRDFVGAHYTSPSFSAFQTGSVMVTTSPRSGSGGSISIIDFGNHTASASWSVLLTRTAAGVAWKNFID